MGRRGGAGPPPGLVPRSVPEADVFRFDEVDLAGGRAHSPRVRRGMAMVFDGRGIEVLGPEPNRHAFLPWSEVAAVGIGRAVVGPDGRTETPIEVGSTAGTVRYLVRSELPQSVTMSALEQRVTRWREPTAGLTVETAPSRPPPPRPPARPDRLDGVGRPPGPAPVPSAVPPPPHAPSVDASAPYAAAPSGPFGPHHSDVEPNGPVPRRTRRTVTLVVALVLLLSGVGLAVGLSATSTSTTATDPTTTVPRPSPDQLLAERLMLTRADLPGGWRLAQGGGALATSPTVERGQARITRTLAGCMGISGTQASIVLGGGAADQTAQTSSPIFVAPTSSASAGSALELQTAATVVHSHSDQQADFALFGNPKYPGCVATASAAELQLGVNQSSGGSDDGGPATVSAVALPSPHGVQISALLMAFTVTAGTASVPVQVELISLGAQRVEASLQVFAIGGQIPNDALLAAFSTFEERVASGGKSSVV